MIGSLQCKNFRNFSDEKFLFGPQNIIVGPNGKGKTNILEALSLFSDPLVDVDYEYLVQKGENFFYLKVELDNGKELALHFDLEKKKKTFILGGKNTTKKKISEIYPHVVGFHPITMNILYLSPSERRNFLDEITNFCFPGYKKLLSEYKKVVTSRNKVLKNISEQKSSESELDFWDEKFINYAERIYSYREKIISHFESHIHNLLVYIEGKSDTLTFSYITKVERNAIKESLENYVKTNRQRDIILRKTYIGPHVDDFEIIADNMPLTQFASRGEVKSILLGLKFLAVEYVEAQTKAKPIFVVDDFLSELDEHHRDLLLSRFESYQMFFSSIEDIAFEGQKIYL